MPILALFIIWRPLRTIGYCASTALNVIGEGRIVAVMTVFGMWVIQAGGAYGLGFVSGFGMIGVFLAMLLDEIVRMPVFVIRWRLQKPIEIQKTELDS